MRGGLVLLTAVLVAAPGSAHAGRTFYGWLYGTEVMPERGAELQSWITEENFDNLKQDSWQFSAQIGITDQLELGLPLEIDWFRDTTTMPPTAGTVFSRFGADLRYRFVTQDPVDAPAIVPLLRVGVKRLITQRDGFQPEADLVVSYESGIVQAEVDLGFLAQVGIQGDDYYAFRPGAGVSVLAIDDLRFGAEFFAEINNADDSWYIAGPNMAWTHGRFWMSAAFGVGLDQDRIKTAPRVQWGIAF
ncbi:MAG TPA: hypothetical protein VFV99_14020 [Kofleriaceae bacterium]|nr:hypothetical protein [Kofleriaceae bacterium]